MTHVPPMPARTRSVELSTVVDCPAERLYEFHRDTRNAAKISPGVTFLSIDGDFPLDAGDVFTIRFRQKPLPFVIAWTFLVEELVPNRAVVDVALTSPFRYWRHEHRFDELGPNRARLTDRVTYVPPLGVVGALGDRLVVNRVLQRMFRTRQALTKRLMEAS